QAVAEVEVTVRVGSPLQGVDRQPGRAAVVTEDLERVDPGLGRGAGAHLPVADVGQLAVVAAEGLPLGGHAVAGSGAGYVRAVAAVGTGVGAVDRVGVRPRDRGGPGDGAGGVVVGAGEVVPAEVLR